MFSVHDLVKLRHDVPPRSPTAWPGAPSAPLKAGDVGSIVMVYTNDSINYEYEVEFVDSSGTTRGLLTLKEEDLEPV